jgi:hypothetical protein
MKRCPTCKQDKELTDFFNNKSKKDGLSVQCKSCHVTERRERRRRDPEKARLEGDKWRKANPERVKEMRKDSREKNITAALKRCQDWRDKNRDAIKIYNKSRLEAMRKWKKENYVPTEKDIVNGRIRAGIYRSIKTLKNGRTWCSLVGYGLTELSEHLRNTLPNGYTWKDFLEGKLHIDHIIPLSVFNFKSAEDIDFKRCWSLENLQLLPAAENISKHAKIYKPFQPSLAMAV